MTSPSASGRRRGLPKQMSSEDQALNMIAREAEARLAAKRAARAEARSIRMKELEMKQKEADAQMDKEYERENENDPLKSRRTNTPRMKSSATSSLNSSETNLNELGVSDEYVKQLKDSVKELESKFRKAMVNSAQLDNERQAFQYQVECLKDIIEDLTENLDNITDEFHHKSKDFNKLSREHEKQTDEFEKCMKLLTDRERILDEHGINLDGTLKEPENPDETDAPEDEDRHLTNHIGGSAEDNAEKESLISEIQRLKEEIAELRSQNETDVTRREADHIRRDLQKQIVELKSQVQKLEQDNARQEGQVLRLESQVKRYKTQAESAEAVEDGLLAEKRKIARELRQCQEQILELETDKEHLQKRLDKLKSRRGDVF